MYLYFALLIVIWLLMDVYKSDVRHANVSTYSDARRRGDIGMSSMGVLGLCPYTILCGLRPVDLLTELLYAN